ncbi:acetylornithine aminotransferase [Trueperella bonasi]|uniref:Acetylornithine aminotransferase n=1 Tax=Trueperella bonasi TaxID=312286 RepID=A0ABT9NDW7_9ACTO|nr:acetylornithine transaminase [Trueperella bonasi]MDP9805581.1 acetylornithine aminotransferase [Trueperella bonasi]
MNYSDLYRQTMMNAFGEPQLVIERGEGVYLWDTDGKKYLDLLAGIAVNSLGYGHPAIVKTLTEQAKKVTHTSNFFATVPQLKLAGKLQDALSTEGYVGASARVFFCNSGTEANEAALKIARMHKPGGKIIALKEGFHGRTLGALSITHKPAIREPFEPLPSNVLFIEPTIEALDAATEADVAAIFVEPIQGEAGVRPVSEDFLRRARGLADRYNALLVIDEVQTGMGRTGRWFAHSDVVKADLICLAKGLGGGVPIGAVIGIEKGGRVMSPGTHGTTFGGNPLATAAAGAVIEEVSELLEHVSATGQWLRSELELIGYETRGSGLLIGVAVKDAGNLQSELLRRGFIVNAPNPQTLRLTPPLIITREELQPFIDVMGQLT